MKKKKISILGSTGSIGQNCLDVISKFPERFEIIGLASNTNTELLKKQIEAFNPKEVALFNENASKKMSAEIDSSIKVYSGIEGLNRIATNEEVDLVVSSMIGAAGLIPTFEAIKSGKNIALANKESLVVGGKIITEEAVKKGIRILPIDSEHSAIFQSLEGHRREDIRRIIITASGGPFLNYTEEEMQTIKPEDALKHPNWKMGKKITVDSATMMNKGLEAIEAKWLFDIEIEKISVVVHPESIIHSMVEYIDGSVVGQLGIPDMRIPISLALAYPERLPNEYPSLNLPAKGELTFYEPDLKKFPCLALALEAGKIAGTMPAVLNAANEVAVHSFLEEKLSFNNIPVVIENTMNKHKSREVASIGDVLDADRWAREESKRIIEELEKGL
ncbi:MAG: 1-deoxy-D-xylulose-5-phosphate reductoisomerase [Candidatus Schekmanbacteria bacterium]|nr:MAG: 1-deoxy-D-xylulose-5-phosphate reductoisomerase [Candidatus Schekmanbacteria bacterium]